MKTRCHKCGCDTEVYRHRLADKIRELQLVFEGECPSCGELIRRHMYHCARCNEYTLHRYSHLHYADENSPEEVWVCDKCNSHKFIYIGPRKSPERRNMAV